MTKIEPNHELSPIRVPEADAICGTSRQRRVLPRWAQLSVLVIVFVAGGVVGGMVATRVIHLRMDYYREHAEALPVDIIPRLQSRLALSDKQAEQVKAIIANRHPRMIDNRIQSAQAMHSEFGLMEDEIASVLEPDQENQWRAIALSVRRRFLPPVPATN